MKQPKRRSTRRPTAKERAPRPTGARELRRVLYDDPDSDAIRGLPLKPGITESLFADLAVGCIWRYLARREAEARCWTYHQRRVMKRRIAYFEKKAAEPWGDGWRRAFDSLAGCQQRRDQRAAWLRNDARCNHPIVCLWALFRYLVRLDPGRGVDPYMQDNFPLILDLANLKPQRKKEWTYENITRRFRRCGGKAAADRVAFYLFSTDDRLRRYRPAPPPEHPQARTPDPDLIASIIGREIFRI